MWYDYIMTSTDRSDALRGLLLRVQEIADTEETCVYDFEQIRNLLAEAGIEANAYCGRSPHSMTDDMVIEWVLGQWVDTLDQDEPFLMSARNISGRFAEELCGYVPHWRRA